jgi:hypothetical protein
MRIIYLFIFILFFSSIATGMELKGEAVFNVDSAREYLKEGQSDNIEINAPKFFADSSNVEKMVSSYDNGGNLIGITVQYKQESNKAYIYDINNRLIYVDRYDKSVNIYPHRGYRYNLEGKLILSSLTVSKDEQFRFSPEGKLIVHSIKNIIYDENGKIIGFGK